MISAFVLAVGMLFATFTQLRPSADVALGFGEVLIVAWIGYMLIHNASRIDALVTPAVWRLSAFWLVFMIALCIGTMTAFVIDERNARGFFIHDLLAYSMMAVISLLAAFQARAAARMRQATWFLVLIGAAFLALQLLQGVSLISVPGTDVWYYDRFTGWSTNSNQLGLLCVILALLAFHLAETTRRRSLRMIALLAAVLPVWAGYLSRSDAFLLAMVLSVLGIIGINGWKLVRANGKGSSLSNSAAVLAAIALPIMLGASVPIAQDAFDIARTGGPGKSNGVESGIARDIRYRTALWRQAAGRGAASGLLGLGPGPHLHRPGKLREPKMDVLPDFEAHNTIVDLFLQGGALAVAALLLLGTTAFVATLRANFSILPMLILAVSLFGLTHFVIRHPILWFAITLALVAADAHRAKGRVGRTSTS